MANAPLALGAGHLHPTQKIQQALNPTMIHSFKCIVLVQQLRYGQNYTQILYEYWANHPLPAPSCNQQAELKAHPTFVS
jgi:hypothetical protein